MKWVTRRHIRVNRTATAWLIRRIVHSADFGEAVSLTAEGAGLRAISRGFPKVTRDDHETIERASFLYDALYAALQEEK
jgi:hypothetical protein